MPTSEQRSAAAMERIANAFEGLLALGEAYRRAHLELFLDPPAPEPAVEPAPAVAAEVGVMQSESHVPQDAAAKLKEAGLME